MNIGMTVDVVLCRLFWGQIGGKSKIKLNKNNTNKSIFKYLGARLGARFKFNILIKLYHDP
jgi:hypothetical protein